MHVAVPSEWALSDVSDRQIPPRPALPLKGKDQTPTSICVEPLPQITSADITKATSTQERMKVILTRGWSGLEPDEVTYRSTEVALQLATEAVKESAHIVLRGCPRSQAVLEITAR